MPNPSRVWGQVFIQSIIPNKPPVMVGSLWHDSSINQLKRCTSIDPYTFVSVETGGGGGAPVNAQYVVLTGDSTLTSERVLNATNSIQSVDNGAGSTVDIKLVNDSASPGNSKYYGTNDAGTKGFHTLVVTNSNAYFPAGWA